MPAAPRDFAQVYRAHFDFVWRSLEHLGVRRAVLDDAVQEVWLVVHRRLDSFEGRCRMTTWLFSIAINVAHRQRRNSTRSRPGEPLSDELPSSAPDPEDVALGNDVWSQVQRFMNTLSELQRAIFVSVLIENLTPAETAEAIGIDVEVVYRRVRALRRALLRELQRREERST